MSELLREITDQYIVEHINEEADDVLQALSTLRSIHEQQAVYSGDPVREARGEREIESAWYRSEFLMSG